MKIPATINSRKFDKKIHRTWHADLIESNESHLVFVGCFENELNHPEIGLIRRGTISFEYYWLDKWFNIFRFHEPDGSLRNYYCNINLPPKFEKGVLDYTDLDVDILVWKDFRYKILDLNEFKENAFTYIYPAELQEKVFETVAELLRMIEVREFPFNFDPDQSPLIQHFF